MFSFFEMCFDLLVEFSAVFRIVCSTGVSCKCLKFLFLPVGHLFGLSLRSVLLVLLVPFVGVIRDLEGRRMRIVRFYVCGLLYFLLKVAAFDVPS